MAIVCQIENVGLLLRVVPLTKYPPDVFLWRRRTMPPPPSFPFVVTLPPNRFRIGSRMGIRLS